MAVHKDPRDNFSATGAAVNAGATSLTATQTAATGVQYAITHVSGSTDVAGVLSILDGTTTKWQIGLPANTPFKADLSEPILCTIGAAASVNVSTGSLAVRANLVGYRISAG